MRRERSQRSERRPEVRRNGLGLKWVTAAVDEQLVPSSIRTCSGILLVKGEQPVVERLANCRFVLAAKDVLPGKLRPPSKVDVLITKSSEDLQQHILRSQSEVRRPQVRRFKIDDRLIMCLPVLAVTSDIDV